MEDEAEIATLFRNSCSIATNMNTQTNVTNIEDLKSTLRSSIASKRGSMTVTEIQFVQKIIDSDDVNEDDLTQMNETLKCNQLFFSADQSTSSLHSSIGSLFSRTQNNKDENETKKSRSSGTMTSKNCPEKGSQKRQDYLEAKKKQAAEQAKKRASLLWKQSIAAVKATNAFAAAGKSIDVPTSIATRRISSSMSSRRTSNISQLTVPEGDDEDDSDFEEEEIVVDSEQDDMDEDREPKMLKKPEARRGKHVLCRQASVNVYGGEGFEICEDILEEKKSNSYDEDSVGDDEVEENKELEDKIQVEESKSIQQPPMSKPRPGMGLRRASVNIYGGSGFEVACEDLFDEIYEEDGSHKTEEHYDPWLYQEIDETGCKRTNLKILGTNHDDHDCHPHVLSPIQMDRLQSHLPETKQGQSIWLKYSLVRDGASSVAFLKKVRASPCTLLAMETIDGEVFGGFFARSWTIQSGYFGTGESFLWRMKSPRDLSNQSHSTNSKRWGSLKEQIDHEADLEVFRSEFYYGNNYFQLCNQGKVAAGGGSTSIPQDFGPEAGGTHTPDKIGFGLMLGATSGGSLLEGSSSACLTFRSPPLSKIHSDGSTFELVNLEAWGFTPCITEEEARVLEYRNMFFQRHSSVSSS